MPVMAGVGMYTTCEDHIGALLTVRQSLLLYSSTMRGKVLHIGTTTVNSLKFLDEFMQANLVFRRSAVEVLCCFHRSGSLFSYYHSRSLV